MCELPDTVGESRPGTRVVRVAVDGDHLARQRELARPRCGIVDAEAARSREHELRLVRQHLGPRRGAGRFSAVSEHVQAAGGLDHLGKPVACAERGLDPFGEEHAAPRELARSFAALVERAQHVELELLPAPRDPSRAASTRIDRATSRYVRGSSEIVSTSTRQALTTSALETAQTAHRSCVMTRSGANASISAASTA